MLVSLLLLIQAQTIALTISTSLDGLSTERLLAINGRACRDTSVCSSIRTWEANPLARERSIRYLAGASEVVGIHFLSKKKPKLGKILGYSLAAIHLSLAIHNERLRVRMLERTR